MLTSAIIAFAAEIFSRFIFCVGVLLQKLALMKVEEENQLLKSASVTSNASTEADIEKQETDCETPKL